MPPCAAGFLFARGACYNQLVQQKGFTLIEILIVIVLMALIGFLSSLIYSHIKASNDLQNTLSLAITSATRARTRAQSGDNDSPWGIKFDSTITVFKGSSFATRDAAFDEVTPIAATISPSGNLEIIFNKLTGYPNVTSTIVITNSFGAAKKFDINEKGAIVY